MDDLVRSALQWLGPLRRIKEFQADHCRAERTRSSIEDKRKQIVGGSGEHLHTT
jgi:hypothetical protein